MRYRRFGRSDLDVSEVGFGVWTLASDWWGRVDDPQRMLHAALDAGINFIDTAPVYGDDGVGETLLADVLKSRPRRDRPHDEVRLRHRRGPQVPGPVGATARLGAGVGPRAARSVAAPARHRPHRPLPAAQHAHRADPRRRAVGRAREVPGRGQGSRARRRARSRDRMGRRGPRRDPQPPDRLAADRLQRARAGAGSHVRGGADGRATDAVGLISRVPHASDTLSGKITRDTVFPPGDHRAHRNRDNMLDNFDKAETLHVPLGRHRPHDRSGRDRRHPRQPGVHDRAPHVRVGRRRRRVRRRVRPSAHRRRDAPGSTSSGQRNFGVTDRYVMPLKSSTGG